MDRAGDSAPKTNDGQRRRACKCVSTFLVCECLRERYEWLNERVSARSVKIAASAGPLKPLPLAERDVMVVLSLSREECGTDIDASANVLALAAGLIPPSLFSAALIRGGFLIQRSERYASKDRDPFKRSPAASV